MYAGRHAGSVGKIGKLLASPGAHGLSSWRNVTPHRHFEVISGYFCTPYACIQRVYMHMHLKNRRSLHRCVALICFIVFIKDSELILDGVGDGGDDDSLKLGHEGGNKAL